MTAVTDRMGEISILSFDRYGSPLSIEDSLSHTSRMQWDLGKVQMTSRTDAAGVTTAFEYDEVGNQVSRSNRRGFTTCFDYDDLDRLVKVTDPVVDGATAEVSSRTYGIGNVVQETDRRGIETSYVYDAENRVVETRRDGIRLELVSYDGNGNVLTATDANGHTTSLVYDERNLLVEAEAPLASTAATSCSPLPERHRFAECCQSGNNRRMVA